MHNNTVIMYVCIIRSVIMYALIVIMHNKFVRTIVTLYCMDHRNIASCIAGNTVHNGPPRVQCALFSNQCHV